MSTYILKITEDYKDTSIAKYDNCSVEIMKYHDGVFRFKQQKRKEPYNEIIKEEYCDIKVSSGEIFCNIPTNWLIEQNKK
tara:strand:- start:3359 stop:3598 length:240 start_codon:yes stop_codon:yes gene_type:complete